MLVIRFQIHVGCKLPDLCFKSKPSLLKYFNALNIIKESEYIIAKTNKSMDKHYKKWGNAFNFD